MIVNIFQSLQGYSCKPYLSAICLTIKGGYYMTLLMATPQLLNRFLNVILSSSLEASWMYLIKHRKLSKQLII